MITHIQQRLKPYAPLFLRLGLGAVFVLFGFQKLSSPEQTRAEIQLLLEGGIFDIGLGGAAAVNYYLGITEMIVGVAFLLGAWIRYVAPIAILLTILFFSGIVSKYGISQDPTLNRDLGLLGASIALFLTGAGPLSVEQWLERQKQKEREKSGN